MFRAADIAIFRWINQSLGSPAFDPIVTIFNGGDWFKRIAVLAAVLFAWLGGRRARCCMLVLVLTIAIGDGLICGTLKRSIHRPRPFAQLPDVRQVAGYGSSGSMPSSHAANITAAAIVLAAFYRRSLYVMAPVAVMVCFARVYSGVHFPSDVAVGVLLGGIYTAAILAGAKRWAPQLFVNGPAPSGEEVEARLQPVRPPLKWMKLGWILIGATLVFRLFYLASGKIELTEDEAYQWMWSKHLALSYYSKPPLIAYAQFLGTHLGGDSEFGIRLLAPILAASAGAMMMIFVRKVAGERPAFFTMAAAFASPILAVGATLMTIDVILVTCWTAAMLLAWRAVERDSTLDWIWTGVAIGIGLLAKYAALFQWISIFLFLALIPGGRRQFRRPGLYISMAVSLLALLPVIIWNQEHNWITLTHLNERSGLDQAWHFTTRFLIDFIFQEFGLLNPVFVVLIIWATLRLWKARTPAQTFLLCMGAPLFVGYFLYTLRARVQPNWVAPAILPLFALGATYWEPQWPTVRRWLKPTLQWTFGISLIAVIWMHDTNLTEKVFGFKIPAKFDALRRARGWSELAKVVAEEKEKSGANFVIGGHYGITSLLIFYTPEAHRAASSQNLIYTTATDRPKNQYFFWPNYLERVGESALIVIRSGAEMSPELQRQFATLDDLGERKILYRGREFHTIHLYLGHKLQHRPQ